jgi:CRISPR/Cas system-associated protein endoribonuclease Cas2
LISTERELQNTFYFFGNVIRESMRNHFKMYYVFDETEKRNQNIVWRFLKLSLIGYFRWPFLRKAALFGQDHLYYSTNIIGKHNYTYLEDGPMILTYHIKEKLYQDLQEFWSDKHFSVKNCLKRLYNILVSGVYCRIVANNQQCKEVVLTVDEDVSYIEGKIKTVISLEKLWAEASAAKKEYILNIYNLNKDDIDLIQGKTHILLTQQFVADGLMSEDEQIKIYHDILEKYDLSYVLIKPHPRDLVDYTKYFPGITVFSKVVPMQLLSLVGIRFKKAMTVYSSSISSFPYDIEKEWVGTAIHPALYERYPNLTHNIYED